MNKKILYINTKYFLLTYCNSIIVDEDSYKVLNGRLSRINFNKKFLVLFDMKGVKFSPIAMVDGNRPKKSVLFFTFKDIIEHNSNCDFLFINSTKDICDYLIEKDFDSRNNVFVLSYLPELFFQNGENREFDIQTLYSKWSFCQNHSFLKKEEELKEFVEGIISSKIESFISTKDCIKSIEKLEEHVLKSTPVHVNKYVNLKPILEDFEFFSETCFLLSELIISKSWIPDYIVAPSKNAISIASGLLRYIKTANLIIINQISPITSLNNYSNVESIDPKAKYAIIEDFHCMGTEIKVVKGILWSHGVNVKENVYTFPIACTKIYDKDYDGGYKKQKIYPMYKLGKDINYKMFTHNSCPVCNELDCNHRKLFTIKKEDNK